MMALLAKTVRRKRMLQQVTAWVNPRLGLKDRLRRLRELDQRQSESRITEDALLMYLPILERRILPMQDVPTQRRRSAVA